MRSKRDLEEKIKHIESGSTKGDELLYDTYTQVHRRNVEEGSHAEKDATRAFKLVLCSCEPLTFHALAEAVSVKLLPKDPDYRRCELIEEVTEEHMRNITHNFLIENTEGKVAFPHMSVVDYLRNCKPSPKGVGYAPLECHTEMMHVCLYFVRFRPFGVFPEAQAATKITSDDSLDEIISIDARTKPAPENTYRRGEKRVDRWLQDMQCFLSYSYKYWARHCAVAIRLSRSDCTLAKKLAAVVFSNTQEWLEAFSKWHSLSEGLIPSLFPQHRWELEIKLPNEIRTFIDPDPGIFIAACYGLHQLTDALTDHKTESTPSLDIVNRKIELGLREGID